MSVSDEFDFVNATGQELVDLLCLRAQQKKLPPGSGYWSAVMGAAVTLLAEVVRQQALNTNNPAKAAEVLADHSARWLRELLKPVIGQK